MPAANLTGSVPASALAGVSGLGLVNLNASSLTSGTIPLSVLPGTLGTDVVNDLLVTNAALFTNALVIITNSGGASVTLSNGNILASGEITNTGNLSVGGIISGNGSGLTGVATANALNSSNLLLIGDIIATNAAQTSFIAAAIVIASNNVTLQASNALYTASNSVLRGASNSVYAASNTVESALLSAGNAISNSVAGAIATVSEATPNNIPSALVQRDPSGNISAGALSVSHLSDTGSLTASGISDIGGFSAGSGGQLTVDSSGNLTTSGVLSANGIIDTAATTTVRSLAADSIANGGNLTNTGNVYVTNSAAAVLSVTNGAAGTGVAIDNAGNIAASNLTVTGAITGKGSGLTGLISATGNPLIDITSVATNYAFDTSVTSQIDSGGGTTPSIIEVEIAGTNNGWSVSSGGAPAATTFAAVQSGLYRVDYQAQAGNSGTACNVAIGAVTNSVLVSGSTFACSVPAGGLIPISRSFMFYYTPGTTSLQFEFTSTGGNGALLAQTIGSLACPSFSVTIQRVSP